MRLVGTHTHCGLAHVFQSMPTNVQVELGMSHDRSPSYGDWLHAQRQVLLCHLALSSEYTVCAWMSLCHDFAVALPRAWADLEADAV